MHFIPFAVMLALYLLLMLFRPHIPFCHDINELIGYFSDYPLYVVYFFMLPATFSAQVFFYAIPVMKQLRRLRKLHLKYEHPVKHIDQYFTVLYSFAAYPFVCMFFFFYYNNMWVLVAHNFSLPVFVTVISIYCMNQKLPLQSKFTPYKIACQTKIVSDDHKNGLNPIELKERIHTFIETKQQYRNVHLTIQDVADHLNINRTYLSAFINKEYNCDFRKLLNAYRMEAAKRLLLDIDFDIKNIAYAVGYSSRTTFYKAFKENVSDELMPAEWREARLKEHLDTPDNNFMN